MPRLPAGNTAGGDVAVELGRPLSRERMAARCPVSAGGRVKTAVQLLLPEMDGIAGFYEARTDRALCVRRAGRSTPAGTPIPEPDCGDLHCSRCRPPLRRVKRRAEPAAAAGLFA